MSLMDELYELDVSIGIKTNAIDYTNIMEVETNVKSFQDMGHYGAKMMMVKII